MDRIYALQNNINRTEEEEEELMTFYREQANSFNSTLKTQLKKKAEPLVQKLAELESQLTKLQENSEVTTLSNLRAERSDLNKKVNEQAKKDACKTYLENEKKITATKKSLNELQKQFREAGGEGRLPGIPERKRGGRKKASNATNVKSEEESQPSKRKRRKNDTDEGADSQVGAGAALRFAGAE